jgi:Ca2+-binding RTX toxin-like protein
MNLLWGTRQTTHVATASEYQVTLTNGARVRYLSTLNNLTYTGAAGSEVPQSGTYDRVELMNATGTTVLARLSSFGNQPLTSVFSDPDATVLAFSDTLEGAGGTDVLVGLDNSDTLVGFKGSDVLLGGGGDDTFDFFTDEVVAGEVIDGGFGLLDRLLLNGNVNFTGATISSVERLEFRTTGPNTATFTADQLGSWQAGLGEQGFGLARDLSITGSAATDNVVFNMGTATSLDLSLVGLSAWTAGTDTVTVNGDADAESITAGGFFVAMTLNGNGGDDTLIGDGDDTLNGGDGSDTILASAGGTINGGTGGTNVDTLAVRSSDDFSSTTITSIERLSFTEGAAFATFLAAQLGGGILAGNLQVNGSSLGDRLTFMMGASTTIDLSGFVLSNWTGLGSPNPFDEIVVFGDADAELMIGSSGDDRLVGNDGSDTLNGGPGADALSGGGGTDILYFDALDAVGPTGGTGLDGGDGYDYAFALGAAPVIVFPGSISIESVTGGPGDDFLNAFNATFDATLNGMGGADFLQGGAGNDTIFFDALDTVVDGGAGTDFAWAFGETAPVSVNLAAQHLEIVWGGAGGDTLNAAGTAVAVQIDGMTGNDAITGGNANNILIGNGGADQITGGGVGDQLYFDHLDTVVNGGGGFDYAYVHNSQGVAVNLAAQQLEAVFGGFLADNLDASAAASTVYLLGNTGADQLRGGAASDLLYFDHEDTIVTGGAGYDFAYAYNVGATPVTANLFAQGLEEVWGGFGGDTLNAFDMTTSVVLVGLDGADTLTGGNANDTLSGGGDNDLMQGGYGNDTLFGEGGAGDVAVYELTSDLYTWTNLGGGVVTVAGLGFVDTLYNVEFLRFAGGGPDIPI